ncbi:MAG: PD-(D/E)XK nuclease family protein [bacterium]|nr:PD-(D/E)XK nuclease family protein [bacterium]
MKKKKEFVKPLRLSFSQLMTYVRCPEHYLFRYIFGIRTPSGKAMKQGSALHDAIAEGYMRKMEEGRAPSIPQAQEMYRKLLRKHLEDYYEELERGSFLITKEFLAKERKVSSSDLLDAGTRGIAVYKKEIERRTDPLFAEEPFEIPLRNNIELVGRIDLVDTSHILHETKTTKKKPVLQQTSLDPQLAFYQFAYEYLTSQKPKSMVKDFLILGKKDAFVVRYPVRKSEIGKNSLFRIIDAISFAVRNNVWYCVHTADSWVCSQGWCGYFKLHRELRKVGLERMKQKYMNKK